MKENGKKTQKVHATRFSRFIKVRYDTLYCAQLYLQGLISTTCLPPVNIHVLVPNTDISSLDNFLTFPLNRDTINTCQKYLFRSKRQTYQNEMMSEFISHPEYTLYTYIQTLMRVIEYLCISISFIPVIATFSNSPDIELCHLMPAKGVHQMNPSKLSLQICIQAEFLFLGVIRSSPRMRDNTMLLYMHATLDIVNSVEDRWMT